MELLPRQPLLNVGDLINPYNGRVLTRGEVEGYNAYTREFNEAKSREAQRFFLSQRREYLTIIFDGDLQEVQAC
jgi:hypothetical protein